eukprot:6556440-Pyramimonas_sp.AAC.1
MGGAADGVHLGSLVCPAYKRAADLARRLYSSGGPPPWQRASPDGAAARDGRRSDTSLRVRRQPRDPAHPALRGRGGHLGFAAPLF